MKYIGQPITVEAVQWTGDNVAEIQQLLAPESPLYGPKATGAASGVAHHTIGVECARTPRFTGDASHELKFATLGEWIVVQPDGSCPSGRRVAIVGNAEFEQRFSPMVTDSLGSYAEGGSRGHGQWATEVTHPRVTDRQLLEEATASEAPAPAPATPATPDPDLAF